MLRMFKNCEFDLFAVPITLNKDGKVKANSRHGIFMTLLFAGFIAWSVYSLSNELFARKSPNTLNYNTFSENPAPMTFSKETFPFAFGLQLPILQNLTFFKDETIYVPDVKVVIFKVVKHSDGTVTKERELVDIETEACTLEHFGDSWASFQDLPLQDLYCLKQKQANIDRIVIEGIEDFHYYSGLNVAIVKCQNTTSTCKTDAGMDEKLSGAWFNLFYTQSSINPQNFSHPNQRFKTSFTSMVTPAIYKSAIMELSHLEVVSDHGWLFETLRTQNYIKMNSPAEYLDLTPSSEGFLWNGIFQISQVVTRYERKYTKLQTVLGQIQGSAATVILILVIVLRPYSQVKFNETLINELFDVKMKKRNKKSKKKGDDKKKCQKQDMSQPTTSVLSGKGSIAAEDSKARNSLVVVENGKNSNLEIQLNEVARGIGGDLESARITDFPTTDRGLLTFRGTDEVIPFPDMDLRVDRYNSTHSFRRLMFAIDNDSHEIPSAHSHFYQKSPLPQYQAEDVEHIEEGDKIEAMKMSKIELNMILEKPETVKLPPMADFVSDTPRKLTEISSQEEAEEGTNAEERKNENTQEPCEKFSIPPVRLESSGITSPGVINLKEKIGNEPMRDLRRGATFQDEDDVHYGSSKIEISLWEFICSFFKKTEKTREKFEVLDKGMKNVRERMDILNIMKKFRELDKLKTLLLEDDQLVLFNAIPKTEIRAKGKNVASTLMSNNDLLRANSFSRRIIKRSTFIDANNVKQEQIGKSYENIQSKTKKSKLDYRLLEIYDDIKS